MDFKWKLTRPGIELEFETGSIAECIGLLEQEGTQISEVFGFTVGAQGAQGAAITADTDAVKNNEPKKPRKPRAGADPATAVAPDPLPIPSEAPTAPVPPLLVSTTATLPPNALSTNDDGIPAILRRAPTSEAPPPLPSPPLAPVAPTPPPVGVLGPKVVKALDIHAAGKPDGGAALVQWLIDSGVPIIKGVTYDEACRAVLMISDEKLKGVADRLGAA